VAPSAAVSPPGARGRPAPRRPAACPGGRRTPPDRGQRPGRDGPSSCSPSRAASTRRVFPPDARWCGPTTTSRTARRSRWASTSTARSSGSTPAFATAWSPAMRRARSTSSGATPVTSAVARILALDPPALDAAVVA